MKEYHIYGIPGSGKTTRLAQRSIPEAVQRYGADKVVVVSFTRTSAKEIASRQIAVEPQNVGTLHAMCYRVLGHPEIAEAHLKEWNKEFPGYAIKSNINANDLHTGGGIEYNHQTFDGDRLLQEYNLNRNKLIPTHQWSPALRLFASKWEAWKDENDYLDFTDLIERALNERPYPPNNALVLIVDEAQDLTPLQLKLVRSWGQQCDYLLLAGDDDQTIYSFSGASPDVFLKAGIDDDHKIILDQSHRVPKKILDLAIKHITQIHHRQPKDFKPTDKDGFLIMSAENYKHPDKVVLDASKHVKEGKTVMFLASCSYMLPRTIAVLKQHGIPFHNPYRPEEHAWNPLLTNENSHTGSDIIKSFLDTGTDEPYWDALQFWKWATALKEEVLTPMGSKGLKTIKRAIDDNVEGLYSTREVVHQILAPTAIEPALNRDIEWLKKNIRSNRLNAIRYPLKVYEKFGLDGLRNTPKIIIGTIHSCKGGEADVVYLFPDISRASYIESQLTPKAMDAIHRLFYVGITRAKEHLCIMSPVMMKGKPYFYKL